MNPANTAPKEGPFLMTEKNKRNFWKRVAADSPEKCWEWTGSKCSSGYGTFWANGKVMAAHRVSYFLKIGQQFGPDFHCCHSCDNPRCVNPSHLWIGSCKDNMMDREMKGRGRQPRGILNGSAKLDEKTVLEIRRIYSNGKSSQRFLAKQFDINHTMVGFIVRRENWKHI